MAAINPAPPLLLLLLLLLSNLLLSSAAFPLLTSLLLPILNHLLPRPLPSPVPPPPGPTSFTAGKGVYRFMSREFVRSHNAVRARLSLPPLRWSRRLAAYSQAWSDARRADCAVVHSGGPYGENIFWGSGWSWKAADAVVAWARELGYYDAENNACAPGHMCGHFTQVAWNGTRRIGCGRTECFRGGVIITCSYDPPGNFLGERPFVMMN